MPPRTRRFRVRVLAERMSLSFCRLLVRLAEISLDRSFRWPSCAPPPAGRTTASERSTAMHWHEPVLHLSVTSCTGGRRTTQSAPHPGAHAMPWTGEAAHRPGPPECRIGGDFAMVSEVPSHTIWSHEEVKGRSD